jgi:hypothetical protein
VTKQSDVQPQARRARRAQQPSRPGLGRRKLQSRATLVAASCPEHSRNATSRTLRVPTLEISTQFAPVFLGQIMAAVATRPADNVKPVLPVSPASSSTMAPNESNPSPPLEIKKEDVERGRRRSRSLEKDEGDQDEDGEGHDDHRAGSSNSDGPLRKRKRTRKVLDKKFDCPHEGCGKSYSRAEHLYVPH